MYFIIRTMEKFNCSFVHAVKMLFNAGLLPESFWHSPDLPLEQCNKLSQYGGELRKQSTMIIIERSEEAENPVETCLGYVDDCYGNEKDCLKVAQYALITASGHAKDFFEHYQIYLSIVELAKENEMLMLKLPQELSETLELVVDAMYGCLSTSAKKVVDIKLWKRVLAIDVYDTGEGNYITKIISDNSEEFVDIVVAFVLHSDPDDERKIVKRDIGKWVLSLAGESFLNCSKLLSVIPDDTNWFESPRNDTLAKMCDLITMPKQCHMMLSLSGWRASNEHILKDVYTKLASISESYEDCWTPKQLWNIPEALVYCVIGFANTVSQCLEVVNGITNNNNNIELVSVMTSGLMKAVGLATTRKELLQCIKCGSWLIQTNDTPQILDTAYEKLSKIAPNSHKEALNDFEKSPSRWKETFRNLLRQVMQKELGLSST